MDGSRRTHPGTDSSATPSQCRCLSGSPDASSPLTRTGGGDAGRGGSAGGPVGGSAGRGRVPARARRGVRGRHGTARRHGHAGRAQHRGGHRHPVPAARGILGVSGAVQIHPAGSLGHSNPPRRRARVRTGPCRWCRGPRSHVQHREVPKYPLSVCLPFGPLRHRKVRRLQDGDPAGPATQSPLPSRRCGEHGHLPRWPQHQHRGGPRRGLHGHRRGGGDQPRWVRQAGGPAPLSAGT
jgi:hypothetical protein